VLFRLQYINETKVTDARVFRRTLTPAEMRLWIQLRGRKAGKFEIPAAANHRRFITDFYCEEGKFCVEVDAVFMMRRIRQQPMNIEPAFSMPWYKSSTCIQRRGMSNLPSVIKKLLLFSKKDIIANISTSPPAPLPQERGVRQGTSRWRDTIHASVPIQQYTLGY